MKMDKISCRIVCGGLSAIITGMLLNIIARIANGGMPVVGLLESTGKWVPLGTHTRFYYLGDILSYYSPISDTVYYWSIGDMLVIMGYITVAIGLVAYLRFSGRRSYGIIENSYEQRNKYGGIV